MNTNFDETSSLYLHHATRVTDESIPPPDETATSIRRVPSGAGLECRPLLNGANRLKTGGFCKSRVPAAKYKESRSVRRSSVSWRSSSRGLRKE